MLRPQPTLRSFAASANSELRRNHSNADNARAISLYERMGFERVGVSRNYALRGSEFIYAVSVARLANKQRAGKSSET